MERSQTTAIRHGRGGCVIEQYQATRQATESIATHITPEDACVQSMTDASPAKWHLAHTTWFFEQFVLREIERGFRPHDERYQYLFNSYYNALGDRQPRPKRGMMTRPSLDEVTDYRRAVDERTVQSLDGLDDEAIAAIGPVLEVGLQHEQQHQELMLTDVRHLLFSGPLHAALIDRAPPTSAPPSGAWIAVEAGLVTIGNDQPPFPEGTFTFDNESPVHKHWLEPYQLRRECVTNAEYAEFIRDGGYEQPDHWLDEGWETVQREGWAHPLYWIPDGSGGFAEFSLAGLIDLDPHRPVCGISLYEADAFARWAGARLPTEQEWEHAAAGVTVEGNTIEDAHWHPIGHPIGHAGSHEDLPANLYGDVWEWTASQYRPYPGYRPPQGAIGEYNGKFMCNQFVLRGGSCASPSGHLRVTYRNFFHPSARWQFSGIRLARDKH